MTGERIAELMLRGDMKVALAKVARRYSADVLDQEEYIDDAWLRIAKLDDSVSLDACIQAGKRAIHASYYRAKYDKADNVQKKRCENLYGYSESARLPRSRVDLGRRRYLDKRPAKLSGWYYHPEWLDLGLEKSDLRDFTFHEIVVL